MKELAEKRRAVKALIGKYGIHSVGYTVDNKIAVSFETDRLLEDGMRAVSEIAGDQCIAIIDDSCLFRDESDGEYWDDYQGPLSVLLREGVLHPTTQTNKEGEKLTSLFVICNDTFAWGCADAENLPYDQIGPLFDEFTASGHYGVTRWCARMREMPPQAPVIHWMKQAGEWTEEMQALLEKWRAENPDCAWRYGFPGGGSAGSCFVISCDKDFSGEVYFSFNKAAGGVPTQTDKEEINAIIASGLDIRIYVERGGVISEEWQAALTDLISRAEGRARFDRGE